ncbi:MAG TPA: nuclear transport factor 2 family protein [Jatrophihabitans sp.]|nr:nuclear transport factor 2 family protein [Jatrophihabitans sp.]
MWLRNVRVVAPAAEPAGPCWVEVVPTGAVRTDPPPAAEPVLDGAGLTVELAPYAAIAEALIDAIVSGDRAAAGRLYAEDLVVWHNHDGIDRDKRESLELLDALAHDYAQVQATDIRIDHLGDGYVQRTVFRTVDHAGNREQLEAMMRVWVRDGRISRIEEYTAGNPQPR